MCGLIARAVVKAVVPAFVRRSWRSVKCLPGTSKPLLLTVLRKEDILHLGEPAVVSVANHGIHDFGGNVHGNALVLLERFF